MSTEERDPYQVAGSSTATGWALVVLAVAIIVMALWADGDPFPEASRIHLESALEEPVLVDVRFVIRHGEVEGPIARTLEPDSNFGFHVPGGREACLRIIDPGSGRVTALHLPGGAGTRMTLRLHRAALESQVADSGRCTAELRGHRVRIAHGRYFDPERPDRIRRERLLRR